MKKYKPILFSTPMVQALLDGRKTQTRRILKSNYSDSYIQKYKKYNYAWPAISPYGQVGDLLWVRETFNDTCGELLYKADNVVLGCAKWKPLIFMPKWASRITLEITNIKVERLQDISEEDAKAEGSEKGMYWAGQEYKAGTYKLGYFNIWEAINGGGSWNKNPFVWAIEFKVHKCNFIELLIKELP